MVERVWREEFKIHSYEIGPSGYATPQALCRFMQDAASNHADDLGVSSENSANGGLMWVLGQLSLAMDVYPKWHESVVIETWPVKDERVGVRGQRDFRLRDAKGNDIGRASTIWLLLNQETRRPTRIPRDLNARGSEGLPNSPLQAVKASEIEEAGAAEEKLEFKIRGSDIDWNMHVNNVCYVDWALETVPAQYRLANKVVQLDVMFVAEGKYGSEVIAERFAHPENAGEHLHRIADARTTNTLSLARTVWRPK